ncbi:MAG: single-stranded-DNA-specific exonuclease RecJ [Nitrococcus mobilis]|nr:single-stranded-DNA-specific exonuclease RecJ [Nitrococcus mobilis]
MFTWTIRRRPIPATIEGLPQKLHPVLRRVYAARNVRGSADLEHGLSELHPPHLLSNVDAAAELLAGILMMQGRILIVGDFDADGATSTALAIRALRAMGAEAVDYLVPNRFDFGYGLSPEIVQVAQAGRPDVIVTVDNGISSFAGVAAANAAGIQVIITDHHLPGSRLPDAAVIVNPNLPGDLFPSKSLAGVGVIFYVMLALRTYLRATDWFTTRGSAEPNLAQLLDLVALGTVADMAVLDRNNRILVEQGLRRMRAGQACPGILALLAVAGRAHHRLVAADLGFAVGPRLNAAGRLEDMSRGVECLLTDCPQSALMIARELDAFNQQRREIEQEMQQQALASLEVLQTEFTAASLPRGLCLLDAGWHQGVIGILASRIKQRWHRPVIAFAPAADGTLRGSARSVPGLHIRDLLERVSSRNPGLIVKFGGHAMAAGLTLHQGDYDRFRLAFEASVAEMASEEIFERIVLTDGELEPDELDLSLARTLRMAGPWGQGFPEPVFDGVFAVVERRVVGEEHVRFRLQALRSEAVLDAIAFGATRYGWDKVQGTVRLAFRLDVNEFRGRQSLQLVIEYLEPAS